MFRGNQKCLLRRKFTQNQRPRRGNPVSPVSPVSQFAKQLRSVGIDTTSDLVETVLNDLEHGADIGATGGARLPTKEENARSAFTYRDRLQEALQELILQGAIIGPLFEEEVEIKEIKVHAMDTKLKPTGKVRSLVDCSKPRLESSATLGYMYNPDYPGSLNSTIMKS